MSILEPKVSAKLTVDREGDAAAFEETASDVRDLGAAAGDAQAPLGGLLAEFKRFASESGEAFGPAKADLEEFAGALEELAAAEGLEQQKAAVDKATAAWEKFGERVPESVRGAVKELSTFDSLLDELQSVGAGLADPIVAAAGRARQAVAEASSEVKNRSTEARTAVVEARVAVEDYAEALREAKAAGATVTGDQVAELERLQTEYNGAVQELAKFRRAQQDVKREVDEGAEAIGGNVQRINSLDDIMKQVNPRLANFALRWGAIAAGVAVAFTAIDKLEAKLNQLSVALGGAEDAFDIHPILPPLNQGVESLAQGVDDLSVAIERLKSGDLRGALLGVGQGAEELANLQRILRSEGIDPTNLSLEEQRRRVEELGRTQAVQRGEQTAYNESVLGSVAAFEEAQRRVLALVEEVRRGGALSPEQVERLRDALSGLAEFGALLGRDLNPQLAEAARGLGIATTEAERTAQGLERLAASAGASARELAKQTAELLKTIEATQKLNPNLNTEQLSALFKEPIQAALDAYAALGAQAPAELQKIADKLGVVSSATEELAKRTDALLEKILGSSKLTVAELKKQQEELRGVLELVDPKKLKFENPEAFARLQEEIKKLLEGFREFGIKVPQWLAEAATGADLFVAAMEVAGASVTPFAGATRDLGVAATDAASGLAGGAQATQQLGTAAQGTGQIVRRLTGEVLEVGEAAEASGEDVDRIGGRIVEVGEAADHTGDVIRRTGEDVNLFAASAKQAGEEAQGAAAGVTAAGDAAGDAATSFVEAGRKATEAGTAVKTAGKGAKEGASGFGDLDVEAVEATGAVEELRGAVEGATQSIAVIDERVAALSITVGGLVTAVGNLAAVRFAEPILAELALVDVKLAEVLRKVGTLKQELEG
ncbi:MAG TPA: hypothetical protein VNJ70_17860 [Thermoanaerobaculia bacterium]|nr:hypothetical protein [Thermoanaerobaculia bacterium]